MSDEASRAELNFRSSNYFIARTIIHCWCCRAPTRLIAAVLPPLHEALAMDDGGADDGSSRDVWGSASRYAFLFYLGYLPDAVRRRFTEQSRSFRWDRSAASQGSYWANHCQKCDALLDDHYLFCEPEGAFAPTDPASAGEIELLPMREPFEAAAAGYTFDPPFIESMIRR
jgi:hypothetical protein